MVGSVAADCGFETAGLALEGGGAVFVLVMIVTLTFLSLEDEGVTVIVLCVCGETRGTVLVGGGGELVAGLLSD